jgi:hypothetical protein
VEWVGPKLAPELGYGSSLAQQNVLNFLRKQAQRRALGQAMQTTVNLHHIVPLEAGGTNDFDNLIPIDQTMHRVYSGILHSPPYPAGRPGYGLRPQLPSRGRAGAKGGSGHFS